MLGGYNFNAGVGQPVDVRFSLAGVTVEKKNGWKASHVPFEELVDFEVSGPGTVVSGGGFIGGGFGVDGAVVGIAVAAVLNALTTRSAIITFLRLEALQGELYLHYGGAEPQALAIELSPFLFKVRSKSAGAKSQPRAAAAQPDAANALPRDGRAMEPGSDAAGS